MPNSKAKFTFKDTSDEYGKNYSIFAGGLYVGTYSPEDNNVDVQPSMEQFEQDMGPAIKKKFKLDDDVTIEYYRIDN